MRSLNLDQVRSLVAIADLGSFAAAAQALHLAPPTISLHISELESRLGAPLLLRGKQGARLTPAGAVLVQRGRLLLRDAKDAVAEVQHHAQGLAGKVRLATQTSVLVYLLPQLLAQLALEQSDIEVDVAVLGTHDCLAAVRAGKLELGLITLPLPQPVDAALECRPWRSDPVMAYLPPDWDLPAEISPAWLADKPLIFNDASTQLYRHTMAWFGQAGFSPSARIELNYTEAMKSMVAAGYGAALLPQENGAAPHAQATHERVQMRPLRPPLTRELALVHRPLALLAPNVLPVLELLQRFAQNAAQPASQP